MPGSWCDIERGSLKAVRATRTGTRQPQRLIARASDPGFREEIASAVAAIGAAAKRSQSMGIAKAVEDKRVGELVRDAASHVSTAFGEEPKRKSHTLRTLAVAIITVRRPRRLTI